MKTLSRYVLREHLGPFIGGFALIIFVLVIDVILQMMDQVLSKGLSPGEAGRLFLYNMAWIVALAVPMAVLVAVLMAFGRLAADAEIMAAKACGVGFFLLLRPVLAAGGVLALLMVLFNDQVLPDWNHEARNIASNLKRRKAALVLKEKEGVFIHDLSDYSLLIRRVDEESNRLGGITLIDATGPGPPTTLHAPSGEVQIFDDGSYIRLALRNGEFHRVDSDDPRRFVRGSFDRQIIHIEDQGRALSPYRSAYRSDREMNIAAMYHAAREHRRDRSRLQARMDSTIRDYLAVLGVGPASSDSASTWADTTTKERALRLRRDIQRQIRLSASHTQRANEFLVEIHKKFSIPVACLVFVLVGAPLGALVRRRGTAVSVGISLLFFLVYWMFLIGGEELADRGYITPALSMWAANLVFGLLGVYLIRAAVLDQPLLGRRRRRGSGR